MSKELTKMDINAMKKADDLVFRCNGSGLTDIEAIKRPDWKEKERDPFVQDRRHVIEGVDTEIPKCRKGFSMVGCHQFCEITTSIIGTLRAGDRIVIVWNEDGYRNDYTKNAGLHVDTLLIRIYRKELRKYVFMVSQSICEDNSARMITRA